MTNSALIKFQAQAALLNLKKAKRCNTVESLISTASYELAEKNIPSKDKKMKRSSLGLPRGVVDDDFGLDKYYVLFINDTLGQIRTGHTAYIFKLEHMKEILRFEPNATFRYNVKGDCIEVRL